jgi:hypothetical protein
MPWVAERLTGDLNLHEANITGILDKMSALKAAEAKIVYGKADGKDVVTVFHRDYKSYKKRSSSKKKK